MKITQPSQDTLQVTTSAAGGLTVGVVFIIIGLAGLAFGFVGHFSGSRTLPLAGGALFFLIGLVVFITASSESVVLRKGGQSSVEKKRAIGGSSKSQAFDTASIRSVRLVTTMGNVGGVSNMNNGMNNTGNNDRRSTLSLMLNDNSEVVLGSAQNGGMSVNGVNVGALIQKAPLSKEADQISQFLGVPLDAGDFTNPITAIRSVADAVMGRNEQPQATPPTVPGSVNPVQEAPPAQSYPQPQVQEPQQPPYPPAPQQ